MTNSLQLPEQYRSNFVKDPDGILHRVVLNVCSGTDDIVVAEEFGIDEQTLTLRDDGTIPNFLVPELTRLLQLYHDDAAKLRLIGEERQKVRLSDLFGLPCPRCNEPLRVVSGISPADIGFGCRRCSSGMKMYSADYFFVALLRQLQQEQQDESDVRG